MKNAPAPGTFRDTLNQQREKEAAMAETKNVPASSNGYDPKVLQAVVERIEDIEDEIAALTGEHLSRCKVHREGIKDILNEAKDANGIPKKELKAVLKSRKLERKAKEAREELEDDEQESYDMIRHALGDLADLPLGKHALN